MTNAVKITFAIVMAVALLSVPCPLLAGDTVTPYVTFQYQGKPHTIIGRQAGDATFVFNRGASKKITLATLNWAPYIGNRICGQGWVQQLTIALLTSQGYEITTRFYPWMRAVAQTEHGRVDLLYPEYFIEPDAPSDVVHHTRRRDHLALSLRIPGGPVALMKLKGAPIPYTGDLRDLKDEKIGVVRGYQNTPEFDRLMDSRSLSPAIKQDMLKRIEMVEPVLQYNYLYYAFSKKRPGWERNLAALNRAIKEFEASGELIRIIRNTNDTCGFDMETLLPFQDKR